MSKDSLDTDKNLVRERRGSRSRTFNALLQKLFGQLL
jgi:hypothetical protein